MTRRRVIHGPALAMLAMLAFSGRAAAEAAMLEPYQMVRSPQLVQDSIARAITPRCRMQRKLPRTHRSALSPAEIARLHRRTQLPGDAGLRHERRQSGDDRFHAGEAASQRRPIARSGRHSRLPAWRRQRPRAMRCAGRSSSCSHRRLGAFLALLKGSVAAADDPLLAKECSTCAPAQPGTLVEEAALRRSIALHPTKDVTPFLVSCSQYVRRCLQSPMPANCRCPRHRRGRIARDDRYGGSRHHRRGWIRNGRK